MSDVQNQEETLESFSKSGVLPQRVSKTGLDSEPLIEVIICDLLSGGAQYEEGMPKRLSLIRRFADGREIRRAYRQGRGSDLLDSFESFFVGHDADSINKKISDLKETDGEGWLAGELLRLVYAYVNRQYEPEASCEI